MKVRQDDFEFCVDHSGTCEKINSLKESDKLQWEAINAMISTLSATVPMTWATGYILSCYGTYEAS